MQKEFFEQDTQSNTDLIATSFGIYLNKKKLILDKLISQVMYIWGAWVAAATKEYNAFNMRKSVF